MWPPGGGAGVVQPSSRAQTKTIKIALRMSGRLIARLRSALFPELELGDAAINAQARRLNAFLLILVVGAVAALVAHTVRGSLVNVGFSLGSSSLMLGLRWWLIHRAE